MAQCFRVYTVLRSQVQFLVLHNRQIITACNASSRAPSVSGLLKLTFKSYAKPLVPFLSHMGCNVPIRQVDIKETELGYY